MANFFEKKKYYFRKFPVVTYTLDDQNRDVLDFIHRWKFRKSVKDNAAAFSKWTIRDSDTIFSISNSLYNSTYYFWIIMMMNDMLDPFFDWPLNEDDFKQYMIKKYGANEVFAHHHWVAEEDDNLYSVEPGTWVSDDYAYNKLSVSNNDYESELNENKRYIKLLKPEHLDDILSEREAILASDFNRRA